MKSNGSEFFNFAVGSGQRVVRLHRRVASSPGWVTRTAGLVFLLILAVPILLLLIMAALGAAIIFGVLMLINGVSNRVRRMLPRDDGRRNVRVIDRTNDR